MQGPFVFYGVAFAAPIVVVVVLDLNTLAYFIEEVVGVFVAVVVLHVVHLGNNIVEKIPFVKRCE